MGARTAIILAIPIALGITTWIVRAPRRDVKRPVSTSRTEARPAIDATPDCADVTSPEVKTVPLESEKIARRWRRDCLQADFELRVRQLIESIDWTRAESRVRFPAEHDLIQAEYDAAVGRLPAADDE